MINRGILAFGLFLAMCVVSPQTYARSPLQVPLIPNAVGGSIDESVIVGKLGDDQAVSDRKQFTNPILADGSDPWVVFKDGFYYYCVSDNTKAIYVAKSRLLSDLPSVPLLKVWQAPEGQTYSLEIWAPELHYLQGHWYVYFTGDNGDNNLHRMHVLESQSDDAQGGYQYKDEMRTNKWAIDGTVLEWGQRLYFIWSGWNGARNIQQNLYIAPMRNPWTLETNIAFRQRYEAEYAQINNAHAHAFGESSNGQVVGNIDYADSSITWTVNVPSAGTYAIDFGYDNGSDMTSTELVQVNGGAPAVVHFPVSGWDTQQTVTQRFNLVQGQNTIRLSKGDLWAEIDYIEVKSPGIDPVAISLPDTAWEKRGGPPWVNEGPEVLQNGGKTMVIYSAAGSWSDDYGLGQLTLVGDDPMDSQAWIKVGAVFQSANDVWGPGHASFTKSPDGKQDWIVYHAAKWKGAAWTRNVRMQPFSWQADGSPNFGQPVPVGQVLNFPDF